MKHEYVKVDEILLKNSPGVRGTVLQLMRALLWLCEALGCELWYLEVIESCKIIGQAKRPTSNAADTVDRALVEVAQTEDAVPIEYEMMFSASVFAMTLVRDALQLACKTQGIAIPGEISREELRAEVKVFEAEKPAPLERKATPQGRIASDPPPEQRGRLVSAMNYPPPKTAKKAGTSGASKEAAKAERPPAPKSAEQAAKPNSKRPEQSPKTATEAASKRKKKRSNGAPPAITERWIEQYSERVGRMNGYLEVKDGYLIYYRNQKLDDRSDKFEGGVGRFKIPEEVELFKDYVRGDENRWNHF